MKPAKLVMSAFGPFRSRTEIPFNEIGDSGLFLICGDTGAGKTTIFDAISFALYGNASGENRTADTFRSDYAEDEDETFVELTFLHHGKEYRIIRNPSYKRTKKRGAGTTEQKNNATLYMPDGEIISGYTQVTQKVTDLLGIDWRQYKQISMLAQGEFMKLLTAGSDERGLIFRKVFSTQIYDTIQKKLKEKANKLRIQCEDIDKGILQHLSGIACRDDYANRTIIEEWKAAQDINQVTKVMELLKILIEDDKAGLADKQEENRRLSARIANKVIEYTKAEQMNKMLADLAQAKEEYDKYTAKSEEVKLAEDRYTLSEKALHIVRPAEENFLRIEKELNDLEEEILNGKSMKQQLEREHQELLMEFRSKEEKKPRIVELTAEISRQRAEIEKFDIIAEQEKQRFALLEKKQKLEQKLDELNHQRNVLTEEQSKRQKELDQYTDTEKELMLAYNQLESINNTIAQLSRITEDIHDIKAEKAALEALQQDYRKAEAEYQKLDSMYQEMETSFLREQAGILAASLQDGMPCPVCGSKEHPHKAMLTKGAPSKEELEREKAELDKANSARFAASGKSEKQRLKIDMMFAGLQDRVAAILKSETGDISAWERTCAKISDAADVTPLSDLLKLTEGKLLQAGDAKTEVEQRTRKLQQDIERKRYCTDRLAEIKDKLQSLEDEISDTKDYLSQAQNGLSEAEGTLSTLKRDLRYATKEEANTSIRLLETECKKLQEELTVAEAAYRKCELSLGNITAILADNEKKHGIKQKAFATSQKEFEDKLYLCGFMSKNFTELPDGEEAREKAVQEAIDTYRQMLMTEEALDALRRSIELYYKNKENLEERICQLTKDTKDQEEKDLEKIAQEQNELNRQKAECEDQINRIYSRLNNNHNIYERVEKQYKDQTKVRQEYLIMNALSRTANGELPGKSKIAFEQYVQAYYFDKVIYEANKRFHKMTNNQYALLRKDDPGDLRYSAGLELEVMDYYTGKARSIKSLSGGESFKAALSLALGLSDVIQSFAGGIEMDAMFVDEGFGSLDSDSLEQAIETLNSLTEGNRMVGIISHVAELKERIDKKIVIEKSMEGSRLKVVK